MGVGPFGNLLHMENIIKARLEESLLVKKETIQKESKKIEETVKEIVKAFQTGKKILIFGNGGSAADSQHLAAEFIGRFQKERRALPAIALTTDSSILTALTNDYSGEIVFKRQIEALGQIGDIALGISTSGNSKNVLLGIEQAKEMRLKTICLTGNGGGKLKDLCDISIIVSSNITARIQESHLFIYHTICELVENELTSK